KGKSKGGGVAEERECDPHEPTLVPPPAGPRNGARTKIRTATPTKGTALTRPIPPSRPNAQQFDTQTSASRRDPGGAGGHLPARTSARNSRSTPPRHAARGGRRGNTPTRPGPDRPGRRPPAPTPPRPTRPQTRPNTKATP